MRGGGIKTEKMTWNSQQGRANQAIPITITCSHPKGTKQKSNFHSYSPPTPATTATTAVRSQLTFLPASGGGDGEAGCFGVGRGLPPAGRDPGRDPHRPVRAAGRGAQDHLHGHRLPRLPPRGRRRAPTPRPRRPGPLRGRPPRPPRRDRRAPARGPRRERKLAVTGILVPGQLRFALSCVPSDS
jgi:hypothetical protein